MQFSFLGSLLKEQIFLFSPDSSGNPCVPVFGTQGLQRIAGGHLLKRTKLSAPKN
jgi:hypothetical protein